MDIIVATTLVTGQELDHTFNAIAKVTKSFFFFRRKSPPTSTHHSDENLLGFSVKCIEDYLFLDFGCGGFVCGGKYGEIDVKGGAFQRNAHVSHHAAQRLWERRGSDQLSVIVAMFRFC
ncbi:hypothetical protein E1A91_D04G114300v1 [Gossypium mustelinum]|uniref:Uncharacterized protein n=1 Tax=Gossypium mustelinum TaxID=34275 RepID=A0A5D2VCT1_GOSMU|nr:hypothetical protein E1A91_D04G114300v1 [Gossypium mustelinum]